MKTLRLTQLMKPKARDLREAIARKVARTIEENVPKAFLGVFADAGMRAS